MPESGAQFSPCGQYRYTLHRIWRADRPLVMFVGLNPSTADAERDDPTIRRCIGYARRWGCGGLLMLNLFAYRATDPRDLFAAPEPVGEETDRWIDAFQDRAELVIAAWGNHGSYLGRDELVLPALRNPRCLRRNRSGAPAHPLYLPGDLQPVPMQPSKKV